MNPLSAGTVLDDEPIGRLLQPRRTAIGGHVVATASHLLVVWQDTRDTPPLDARGIYAQRVFPQSP